ncbi:hypothetical protein AB0H00_23490 [Nocardia sp. NPDC023852]|uniref:hypothetical protein n=1 Tax=Nocardia sp. NPDC023852 TaxID=3154697 RepID=UPI0033ECDC1A
MTVDPSAELEEKVSLAQLPMPPTAPSAEAESCTGAINPRGTGCVDPGWGALGSVGTYWPDSEYVLVGATFAGAPATGAAAAHSGPQVLLVRTDGSTFPNGDGWKCLTCGVPVPPLGTASFEYGVSDVKYPINGFHDGTRALAGNSIIECGGIQFADDRCTPDRMRIYPLQWDAGIGRLGALREPRLHPDDIHIGFSYMVADNDSFQQVPFMGRLVFDPANNRYTVEDVRTLFNPAQQFQPYTVGAGNELTFNPAGMIGEFRGWNHDGTAALGIQHHSSGSIDAWATDNVTGRSWPLTHNAGYTDPMAASPDGRYLLAEQVLGSGRVDFLAAMPEIPPITDQMPTTAHIAGIRNNGRRRFFLPYLVDLDTGKSQQINVGGDPNWNAAADPAWLSDSTGVVWAENLVTAPACDGANPLPCPPSGEPGGRRSRVMIARFDNIEPTPPQPMAPAHVPAWGLPYRPGDPLPQVPHLPEGIYTLRGTEHGSAQVVITENATKTMIMQIVVTYTDFGAGAGAGAGAVINGTERVQRRAETGFAPITWHTDLQISGTYTGTKRTSEPDGFTLGPETIQNNFRATGTMTTVLDGHTYTQPANGT